MGSAAISRMPLALDSLAAWPIVIGVLFVLRAGATAYKEVVVALLDRPGAETALRRFTWLLAGGSGLITVTIAFTPATDLILEQVFGLSDQLAALAKQGLRLGAILPVAGALQNLYVGILVHRHETRAVTASMALFLVVSAAILVAGVAYNELSGLLVGYLAFSAANLSQLLWVWRAARRTAPDAAQA